MKTHPFILALTGSALLLNGCVAPDGSPDNTGTGALIGAGSGALIGGANGRGGGGALIGAAVGAIAGGLFGHMFDYDQQRRLREQAPVTYERVDMGQPLSLADVKSLAKAGINEDVMINQIKNSRTVFHLSAADIIDLRDAGVSDKVVNFMINTAASTIPESVPVVVHQAPPPPPMETVVIAPAPDYVWVGGEWVWNGGWYWRAGHWAYPPRPQATWVVGFTWHDYHGWHRSPGHWR
jgi:outer membrane lipoprotein SlyB